MQFCNLGREFFDYDVVDENMIGWNMLGDYKVLVHTSGSVYRPSTLKAISQWLNQGRDVGHLRPAAMGRRRRPQDCGGRLADGGRPGGLPGPASEPIAWQGTARRGRRRWQEPDYLTKVVTVLDVVAKAQLSSRPLRGWDGQGTDGRY